MPVVNDVKVDLSKLKENIANQKKDLHSKQIAMGGNGAPVKGNKKAFLNELVTSMRHGTKSSAIETIQAVNETVEHTRGVPQAVAKNLYGNQQRPQQNRNRQREQFNPEQPQRERSGASDWGMAGGGGNVSIPDHRYGGSGNADEDRFDQEYSKVNSDFDRKMMDYMSRNNPAMQKFIQQSPYAQRVQNEQIVVEEPQLLNEGAQSAGNLEHMVETALRGAVTNIYTKQKIQEALEEYLQSDDFIEKVGKAILVISKRNKAKQGGK
jgi:hypothetical protein